MLQSRGQWHHLVIKRRVGESQLWRPHTHVQRGRSPLQTQIYFSGCLMGLRSRGRRTNLLRKQLCGGEGSFLFDWQREKLYLYVIKFRHKILERPTLNPTLFSQAEKGDSYRKFKVLIRAGPVFSGVRQWEVVPPVEPGHQCKDSQYPGYKHNSTTGHPARGRQVYCPTSPQRGAELFSDVVRTGHAHIGYSNNLCGS